MTYTSWLNRPEGTNLSRERRTKLRRAYAKRMRKSTNRLCFWQGHALQELHSELNKHQTCPIMPVKGMQSTLFCKIASRLYLLCS
jgi:hypothetical protein